MDPLSATREWISDSWPKIPYGGLGQKAVVFFQSISSASLLAQHLLPLVVAISLLACCIFDFLLLIMASAITAFGEGGFDLTSAAGMILKEHLVALLFLATVPLFCVAGCLPPFEGPIASFQESLLTQEKRRIENAKTDWEILSVEEGSEEKELRKAYLAKMRIFHPDKNLEETALANEVSRLIRNAYDRLIARNREEG